MQKLYYEVDSLDKRCYEQFGLSEDILMENAAIALKNEIKLQGKTDRILIVAGGGNNGADGVTLARMLHSDHEIELYLPYGAKSNMCKQQLQRYHNLGFEETTKITNDHYDVIVDCLFGSGLSRSLDDKSKSIINKLNKISAYKIACDIPSGIDRSGYVSSVAFKADTTITMGALKISLYSDQAKESTGAIKVANLGISRALYETSSDIYLLESSDMKLPFRDKNNSNKGDYGHACIVVGEKTGAGTLSAMSAFGFGSGLVSIYSQKELSIPHHIMQTNKVPANCTAIALGMGLGSVLDSSQIKSLSHHKIPFVIDADMCYKEELKIFLQKENIVLTPHPKEFRSVLEVCSLGSYTVQDICADRLKYVKMFTDKYPNTVLVLKGANTVISYKDLTYISPFGSSNLSKGGSGDVLSGLITALLAQKYDVLDAAISGVLALGIASESFSGNSYALTPTKLIELTANL